MCIIRLWNPFVKLTNLAVHIFLLFILYARIHQVTRLDTQLLSRNPWWNSIAQNMLSSNEFSKHILEIFLKSFYMTWSTPHILRFHININFVPKFYFFLLSLSLSFKVQLWTTHFNRGKFKVKDLMHSCFQPSDAFAL